MRLRLLAAALLLMSAPLAQAQLKDSQMVESYTQYVPSLAHLGLGMLGVRSEYDVAGRSLELGYALVSQALLVNCLLKPVVHEQRPDGSAFNSFPSGHTSLAFLGAELVRQEYGWGWGGAAYGLAASVAVGRVVHRRHWWWDTVAGACTGILCANIGHALVEPTYRLFGIDSSKVPEMTLAPSIDPYSGTLCAQLAMTF